VSGWVEYCCLVSSALPGQTHAYYMDVLPFAIGLQYRNVALHQSQIDLVPPGEGASGKAREILGDAVEDWVNSD
jgi:hypothetical protein